MDWNFDLGFPCANCSDFTIMKSSRNVKDLDDGHGCFIEIRSNVNLALGRRRVKDIKRKAKVV